MGQCDAPTGAWRSPEALGRQDAARAAGSGLLVRAAFPGTRLSPRSRSGNSSRLKFIPAQRADATREIDPAAILRDGEPGPQHVSIAPVKTRHCPKWQPLRPLPIKTKEPKGSAPCR